jgi:hypothetical protein
MAYPNSFNFRVSSNNCFKFFKGVGSANFYAVLASVIAWEKREKRRRVGGVSRMIRIFNLY